MLMIQYMKGDLRKRIRRKYIGNEKNREVFSWSWYNVCLHFDSAVISSLFDGGGGLWKMKEETTYL